MAVAGARAGRADVRVVVALGGFAWQAIWPALRPAGFVAAAPQAAFGHGAEVGGHGRSRTAGAPCLGCYHPSQQNTFTGRLTAEMLDRLFTRANALRGA